jgi:hypothetical protein
MTTRAWWDQASERGQIAVLRRLNLSVELAGVPWAFLPMDVQTVLLRRVQVDVTKLGGGRRQTEG